MDIFPVHEWKEGGGRELNARQKDNKFQENKFPNKHSQYKKMISQVSKHMKALEFPWLDKSCELSKLSRRVDD